MGRRDRRRDRKTFIVSRQCIRGDNPRMHQAALFAQLDQMLRSAPKTVSERDRALFWLYYRQGYTAEEIARVPATGLTAKGVESALRRVTTWLREEIARNKSAHIAEPG